VVLPRHIVGVDFSGAADAGRRIWVTVATSDGERLTVRTCRRGDTLPGSGRDRALCLSALRRFIRELDSAAVGMDFPFGLPRAFVPQRGWRAFLLTFRQSYGSPAALRETCRRLTTRELRRRTDCEVRTPFSPYNLRMYRQTYWGICEVLHPLVTQGVVRVLPMERARSDRPWLLEVCPASTLKALGVYRPYKGRSRHRGGWRAEILRSIEACGVRVASGRLRGVLLSETGGNALDSVVAAYATWRAASAPPREAAEEDYLLEGYVYA
jgi:hypothetical protein